MADLKISQLTSASTPLAGTEEVPIVQSGATKKVSIANLTAGRIVNMLKGIFTNSGSGNSSADFTNTIFQDVLIRLLLASGTTGNKITVQFGSDGGAVLTNSLVSYGSAYGSGLNNAVQLFIGSNAAVTCNSNGTFSPIAAPTASAPTHVVGAMYFDTTLNKLRIGGAAGWETVTSV